MNVENYGQPEIEQVLSKARNVRKEIGEYENHTVNEEDKNLLVMLTNGRIRLYREEVQYRNNLIPERIRDIAVRFQSNR